MIKSVGGWEPGPTALLVRDRFDVIGPLIAGKSVLDCGPGGEEIKPDEDWWKTLFLHAKIKDAAAEVVGVDNDKLAVQQLTAMGYEIMLGDVESLSLGREFDVIVAGEVIEHLSNPGLFLDSARRHLRPEGKLILTTPNSWAIGNLVRSFLGKRIKVNLGHVALYDSGILRQLLGRHGYQIDAFYWWQRVMRGPYKLVRFFPHWALNLVVVASVVSSE